ncbi:MAG: antiviral reverse transcriptase Drt5 [Bacteroidota bacterium]
MPYSASDYLLEDHPRTLFPLNTTKIVVQHCADRVLKYVYEKVLDQSEKSHSFLNQTVCYSSKRGLHLRRTVQLDPVASIFLYDVVLRNRGSFRADFRDNRKSFGFRFQDGKPAPLPSSFSSFRSAISQAKSEYAYSLKIDVSNYFNSLYHHDVVAWFSSGGRSLDDAERLGQFLRQINGGRSAGCLPQGLHPAKVLGAEFLKFVDNSMLLRSELSLRFMDDFYIYSNSEATLSADFVTVQRLLGDKSLSVNSAKTKFGETGEVDIPAEVDEIRSSLLRIRKTLIEISGTEIELEKPEVIELSDEQVEYLIDLLGDPDIDESDAELVLSLLGERGDAVLEKFGLFLDKFPSLSKRIYGFCQHVTDREALSDLVRDFVRDADHVTEDQLFWMAKVAEDYLRDTSSYSSVIDLLYGHSNASNVSKAKILEIPDNRFGLPEMRLEHLRTGSSDWLSWSSAIGTRSENPIQRNHILGYFSNSSSMNHLIAECVKSL